MIVFKQPMRLALAKRHTFKRQIFVFPLYRPNKSILPNSNQSKPGGKLGER